MSDKYVCCEIACLTKAHIRTISKILWPRFERVAFVVENIISSNQIFVVKSGQDLTLS